MTDKALSMIGLATKAGRACTGEFAVSAAVKRGRAFLVIVASDASAATIKSYHDMGEYYSVPVIEYGTKESLGRCCGREYRASVAVTDSGFAKRIMELTEKGI